MYNYFEADDMEVVLLGQEEVKKKLDFLFNHYNQGLLHIKELDDECTEAINTFYWNIYKNTSLSQPEIIDFISEIKINTYSRLAELYKKRMKERG